MALPRTTASSRRWLAIFAAIVFACAACDQDPPVVRQIDVASQIDGVGQIDAVRANIGRSPAARTLPAVHADPILAGTPPIKGTAVAPGPLILFGGGGDPSAARAFDATVVSAAVPWGAICTVDAGPEVEPRTRRYAIERTVDLAGGSAGGVIDTLRSCAAIVITGQEPLALARTLRPGGTDSAVMAEIRRHLDRGRPVAFDGPAALASGLWTLDMGHLDASAQTLLADRVEVTPGLDLVRGAIVETRVFQLGLLGRHALSLKQTRSALGLGLDDGAIVIVRGARLEVRGDHPVSVLVRDAGRTDLMGTRLHLLWPGDRVDLDDQRVTPGQDRQPLPAPPAETRALTRSDIFRPDGIRDLLERLVDAPTDSAIGRAEGGLIRLTIRRTDETRMYTAGGRHTILDLALDIERARSAITPAAPPGPPAAAKTGTDQAPSASRSAPMRAVSPPRSTPRRTVAPPTRSPAAAVAPPASALGAPSQTHFFSQANAHASILPVASG